MKHFKTLGSDTHCCKTCTCTSCEECTSHIGTKTASNYWLARLTKLIATPLTSHFYDVELTNISSVDPATPVKSVTLAKSHQEVLDTALRYALTHPCAYDTLPLIVTSARGLISKQMTDADYTEFDKRFAVVLDFTSMHSACKPTSPLGNSVEILSNAIEQLRNHKVPVILYLPEYMKASMEGLLHNFGLTQQTPFMYNSRRP